MSFTDDLLVTIDGRLAVVDEEIQRLELARSALLNGAMPKTEPNRQQASRARIDERSLLDSLKTPQTVGEISKLLGVTPQAVRYRLERLVEQKRVKRRKTKNRGIVWSAVASQATDASQPSSS